MEKKKRKRKGENRLYIGDQPRIHPRVSFLFFFFSYVEKCVSATNGPLKKPKQI